MALELAQYDFVDFGCSSGGSMKAAAEMFGGARGVGLDINPAKVAKAREAGLAAEVADVTKLGALGRQVRFVVMSHFLEHLGGRDLAAACIRSACTVAKEFVLIRQPWFDSDGDLLRQGLMFYWSNWRGHPYHMTSLELYHALNAERTAGRIARFAIYGHKAVTTSDDPALHSLACGVDEHDFDPARHPPKPSIGLQGVYRELCALAVIDADLAALEARTKFTRRIAAAG